MNLKFQKVTIEVYVETIVCGRCGRTEASTVEGLNAIYGPRFQSSTGRPNGVPEGALWSSGVVVPVGWGAVEFRPLCPECFGVVREAIATAMGADVAAGGTVQ